MNLGEGDALMAEETTQVLADFAATLTYESIPGHVREYCKDILLDTLACALAGHQGEETAQIAALGAQLAQSHESTVCRATIWMRTASGDQSVNWRPVATL
jgi:2-methylcitrate dehydratase PrpD